MSDRAAFRRERTDFRTALVAPLLRQVWAVALVATFGILAVIGYARLQVPLFEATAVVQAGAGADVAGLGDRLLARRALTDLALRHGLAQDGGDEAALVRLRSAVALNAMTPEAGRGLGLPAAPGGVVISVLWPDPEVAARLANDLAQQILDLPDAGLDSALQADLDFYRRDEQRLWQEIAALRAEIDGMGGAGVELASAQRMLALLDDQYAVVRNELAQREVAARRQEAAGTARFSLLQRARSAEAHLAGSGWVLAGVAGSLLLAVAAAFVLERRFPVAPAPEAPRPGHWLARLYRYFDDPDRPVLGMPRFAVVSALIVGWLVALALFLGAPV